MYALRFVTATIFAFCLCSILHTPHGALAQTDKVPDYRELKKFRQVMEIVKKNFLREVTDKELIDGAIQGMLESLNPNNTYLDENEFKELQVETKGDFGGIGIEIGLTGGVLTVVSPIDSTPSFKAGIKPGDKIIKIDGEPTKNITLRKAVRQLRGPNGSKVILSIMREGFKKTRDFTMTREPISVHSVKKEQLEPGYGYIRVVSFQEQTDTDLIAAIKNLGGADKIKGLILDLRNNPGGLLDQAVKVSNLFIDKGLIVYTDGRVKDQRMEFRASPAGTHYNFKMALLINEGSAGSSEIVAGALQDHDRALIFGAKAFGKASVQTIIPLEYGSGIRLSTAQYFSPKGRAIDKIGIQPDVDLKAEIAAEESASTASKFSTSKFDPSSDIVLRKALDWVKSGDSVQAYKLKH